MEKLLEEIAACRICEAHLDPNPVLTASPHSRIAIIGQAPGRIVHESGIPWDDRSGDTLRSWMGVDKSTFYNPDLIALIPMGFCYPGTGKSGDLPPRPECAATWHDQLWKGMENVQLTLLVGSYAIGRYLKDQKRKNLTETVRSWQEYLPEFFPLPHPSPRNNIWQKRNPWFREEVLDVLKVRVSHLIRQE